MLPTVNLQKVKNDVTVLSFNVIVLYSLVFFAYKVPSVPLSLLFSLMLFYETC